jgi:shikimate kinase
MKIFVVGYMYSGKTTVGKQLAKKLSYDFLDTDFLFESHYRISIADYFSKYGEGAFRVAEKAILENLKQYPNDVVISTGGGLPCFENNMELMREMGTVVYLKASVGTVYARFERSSAQRPLLANLSKEEAIRKIESQLTERETFYEQANITLSAENINFEALLQSLAPLL